MTQLINKQLSRVGHYDQWKQLFEGKSNEAFKQSTKLKNKDLYITTLALQKASLFFADLVFKDAPKFVYASENEMVKAFFEFLERNINLEANGKSLASELSWRGCAVRKGRIIIKDGIPQPTFDPVDPKLFYPKFDPDDSTRLIEAEIRFYVEIDEKRYIRKEIHKPGLIKQEVWEEGGENQPSNEIDIIDFYATHFPSITIEPEIETGIDDLLVEYIPNFKSSETDFEGISDYEGSVNLIRSYEEMVSDSNKVRKDNMYPKWISPLQYAKEDKNGNAYLPNSEVFFSQPMQMTNSGLIVPQQIAVDVDTDLMKTLQEILERNIVLNLEMNPAVLGFTKDGLNGDSGKAMRYKLINPLNNAQRKQTNIDQAYRRLAYNTMRVCKNVYPSYWESIEIEYPSMEWATSISEWDETVETVVKMVGTLSLKEQLRQIYPSWSEEKIQQVIDEKNDEEANGLDNGMFKSLAGIGQGAASGSKEDDN